MTIEEKAKVYDEAVKRAKAAIDVAADKDLVRGVIRTILPELRESEYESEDEKTRKQLIDFISDIKRISESGRSSWAVRKDDAEMCNAFLTYLEKQKDASKAIEAVERIDKYVDEHLVNAYDMKDYNPEKKYYCGWDDALGKIAGILQDVYSNKKQKESLRDFIDNFPYSAQKEQKPSPKFKVGDYVIDTNYKGEPLYQIVGIDKECYICEYRGDKEMGNRAVMHFAFNNPYLRLEQKPVEKEITLTSFEGTLNTFLFDFANSHIEDCEPKEYVKKHSAEILKAAYKELNAKLQQDIFEARQEGVRDGYEVAKAEQKPAEWSEEDKEMLDAMIDIVSNSLYEPLCPREGMLAWLKSLRPQPHWKPSEEQMDALKDVAYGTYQNGDGPALRSLYEQLKKLM